MADGPCAGKRVLIFIGQDYEDMELWVPKYRLEEAGAQVDLAGLTAPTACTGNRHWQFHFRIALTLYLRIA